MMIKEMNMSDKIPYDLVSVLVILRDWVELEDDDYISPEHKRLVSLADSLYNNGYEIIDYLKPDYKALFDEYGEEYFDDVIEDASAIDTQINRSNVKDLIAEYNDKADVYTNK